MTDLAKTLKDMVEKYGESVLSDHKRVNSVLSDLARDVPKAQKNAFIKCLEHGSAETLREVAENERNNCKQQLAQKLHEEEGFVLELCTETLDLLEKVLFGQTKKVEKKIICKNCGKELQKEWKICPFCTTAEQPAPVIKKPEPVPLSQIAPQSTSVTQTPSHEEDEEDKGLLIITTALTLLFIIIMLIFRN